MTVLFFLFMPLKTLEAIVCIAINEPDCLVNGYYSPGVHILEYFRSFIIAYENDTTQCSLDEKLSIGCMIVDFLIPLMED